MGESGRIIGDLKGLEPIPAGQAGQGGGIATREGWILGAA